MSDDDLLLKDLPPLPKKTSSPSSSSSSSLRPNSKRSANFQKQSYCIEQKRIKNEQLQSICSNRFKSMFGGDFQLDESQRKFFEYVTKARKPWTVLVQSGPGTGKTFTLMEYCSRVQNIDSEDIHITIYKHDLINPFKLYAVAHTNTSYFMRLYNINYMQYCAFDAQLNCKTSRLQLFCVIVKLLQRIAKSEHFYNITIMDEYTVVNKILLFAFLVGCSKLKKCTIVCGDKYQLQSINETKVLANPSYKMVQQFATREYEFLINHRCTDANYNEIVEYFRNFSTHRHISARECVTLACFFPLKVATAANLPEHMSGVFTSAHHQSITNAIDAAVKVNRPPCEFYKLVRCDANLNALQKPPFNFTDVVKDLKQTAIYCQNNFTPGKHLPYLPLIIGAYYYVNAYSEQCIGHLEKICRNIAFPEFIESLEMRMMDGSLVIVFRSYCQKVMFPQHYEFLMADEDVCKWRLYQFTISPLKTTCCGMQGLTVRQQVNIFLMDNPTNRHIYVYLSRLCRVSQLNRIAIPHQLDALLSFVLNLGHLCTESVEIPASNIIDCLNGNLKFYQVPYDSDVQLGNLVFRLIYDFLYTNDANRRVKLREILLSLNLPFTLLPPPQSASEEEDALATDNTFDEFIFEHQDLMWKLAQLTTLESTVWIYEFRKINPAATSALAGDLMKRRHIFLHDFCELKYLDELNDANVGSTCDVIERHFEHAHKSVVDDLLKQNKYYKLMSVDKIQNQCNYTSSFLAEIYDKLKANDKSLNATFMLSLLDKYCQPEYQKDYLQPEKLSKSKRSSRANISAKQQNLHIDI